VPDETSLADPRALSVEALLRDLARPLLARDGGNVELVAIHGSEVVVRLTGACAGCPGSGVTTDHVLAPLLRTVVDDLVLKVERAP
jgi:Fe-S cluster biogenesis protein NfuA